MFETFKLAHYRFTLTPQKTIKMPAFNKGNILRGAFGISLKKLVCTVDKRANCNACILKEKCAYTLIFNPTDITHTRRLRNAPRGYIMKPPLEKITEYSKENPLLFEMILIGDRVNYLPYVMVALIEVGKYGIGLNRGIFTLGDLSILKNNVSKSIYDADTNTVKNIQKIITGDGIIDYAERIDRSLITLWFLIPTRIRYILLAKRVKVKLLEFQNFII